MAQGSWSTSTTKGITTATYTVGGKALAKITGLSGTVAAKSSLIDGITVTDGSNGNPGTIHLTGKVLGANTVKLTLSNGGSYNLAIDSSVTAPVTSKGSWSKVKSGASTLTGSITTAGYALSTDGKTLSYLPVGENKTLAKISGIAALDEDVVNAALTVDATRDSNGNATITVSSDALTTTNSKGEEVFVGKNVTLSGTGGYVLAKGDGIDEPGIGEGLAWSVSGTTATLKGKTTVGYALTSGTTLTYVKEANITLATVKGLKKGLVAYNNGSDTWVGEKQYDEDGTLITEEVNNKKVTKPSEDLRFDDGVITLNNNVLTSSNVTLTPATGYNYTLALYEAAEGDEEDELAKEVATEAKNKAFWKVSNAKTQLFIGTDEYYVPSVDAKTINYYSEEVDYDNGKVATLEGLKSGLTVTDGAIEGIDVKINPNGKGGSVTINSESVLNKENVSLTNEGSNKYTLGVAGTLSEQQDITVWDISSSGAYLYAYKSATYKPTATSNNVQLNYKAWVPGDHLATVTGLKGDLKENADGSVDGITVGTYDDNGDLSNAYQIVLDKSVLNAQNIAITNTSTDSNEQYKLSLADNVTKVTPNAEWKATVSNKGVGTATYTVKTAKGYFVDGTTADNVVEAGDTITYSKGGTVTTKITGLGSISATDGEIDGITIGKTDTETGTIDKTVIVLNDEVLGTSGNITLTGNYTLALAEEHPINATDFTWESQNKGTVILKGAIDDAGYTVSDDGKTVYYLAATADGNLATLATVSGLKSGSTPIVTTEVGEDTVTSIEGISRTGNKLVLSEDVLGTSKVTVKGNAGYVLALGSDVATKDDEDSWKDQTEWITNKTTATYKTYNKAYYTQTNDTTITYTKPTTGTTLATVTGIKSGVDINDVAPIDSASGTITLGADQLGTANVTLKNIKNTNFKLAIGNGVATSTDTKSWKGVIEWSTSGTTATLKEYNKAYYTKASDTSITYTKEGKPITVYATVSGIKSGVEIDDCVDGNNIITLGLDQLAGKKVTLKNGTNQTYKLAIDSEMTDYDPKKVVDDPNDDGDKTIDQNSNDVHAVSLGKEWNKENNATSATYVETTSKGYSLADDALSITYSTKSTTKTLAKLSGLAKAVTAENLNDDSVVVTEPSGSTAGTIALTAEVLDGAKKVTLGKNDNYKFIYTEDDVEAPVKGEPGWAIKTNATITYQQGYVGNDESGYGYLISNEGKAIAPATNTPTVYATVSGLNKDTLLELASSGLSDGDITVTAPTDTASGVITIKNNALLPASGKVTLGKKDDYMFAFGDEIEKAETFTTPRWYVKSGTATYKTGTTAGYKIAESDGKSISKVNETAGAALLTISGLNKKAVASSDGTSVGLSTKEDTDGDGVKEDVYTQGLYLRESGESGKVAITSDLLNNTTVKLENAAGYTYEIDSKSGYTASTTSNAKWAINKGTATYAATTTAGYVLSDLEDGKQTLTYKKAGNETVATITGLSKTYQGDIDDIIQIDGDNIFLPKAVLGTSNATLKLPKGSTANYTLELAADVPTATNRTNEWQQVTEWVTSGTTATYKKYDKAYYTINNKGVIVYNKPTPGTTFATLKGIKSGVDINDFVNKDTNVITLTDQGDDAALAKSTVTLSNTSGYDFKLALLTTGNNKASTPTLGIDEEGGAYEDTAVWSKVTKNGGTASLKTKITAGFTATSDLKLTYSKAATPVVAKVTGMAIADEKDFTLRDEDGVENRTIELSGSDLYSQKIGVESAYGFAFSFDELPSANTDKTYETATITGSAAADTISVGGASWAVNTGKGDDVVTVTGSGISVTGGAGDDSITLTNSEGGNFILYGNGEGNDTIVGFSATDKVKITKGTPTIEQGTKDIVITVGSGSVTLKDAANLGTISNSGGVIGFPDTSSEDFVGESSSALLADDNYSMDAAALSDIVKPADASYTPDGIEVNYGLTNEDKSAPAITYNTDDK